MFTGTDIADIKSRLELGHSFRRIALHLDIPEATFRKRLKEAGWELDITTSKTLRKIVPVELPAVAAPTTGTQEN